MRMKMFGHTVERAETYGSLVSDIQAEDSAIVVACVCVCECE